LKAHNGIQGAKNSRKRINGTSISRKCNQSMKSLKELYRIGPGPSSSHTIGPSNAAKIFLSHVENPKSFKVTLYGSLAATGKGHMTDVAIKNVLSPIAPVEIEWKADVVPTFHTNGMKFIATLQNDEKLEWTVYSVGGGALAEDPADSKGWTGKSPEIYELKTLSKIKDWCDENGCAYWEYVEICEGKEIWDYLQEMWEGMKQSVERGLNAEGVIPGPLHLARKAANYYVKSIRLQSQPPVKRSSLFLRTCGQRRKRLRRYYGDGSDLRIQRSHAGGSLSSP